MAARKTTRLVLYPDADKTIAELASPQLVRTGEAIAEAMPDFVPVDSGTARATYQPSVVVTEANGEPDVRVYPNSPFWHWLEYGNRYTVAYRPIQRAVESLGLRYEPL